MVVSPSKKSDFDTRTFGSLVFHSLGCEQDPTEQDVVLFECGHPEWYLHSVKEDDGEDRELRRDAEPIIFQPPRL